MIIFIRALLEKDRLGIISSDFLPQSAITKLLSHRLTDIPNTKTTSAKYLESICEHISHDHL